MAVFDRFESNKVDLDDTHQLTCEIEAAQNQQGHTVYVLKVQRGPFYNTSWQISRRYSDFDALNNLLSISGIDLPFPPKKVFGKLEREFIAERQQGLQNYINLVLSHPLFSHVLYVKRFFDPERYSFNFTETSLQHVSMVFRSESEWEVVEPLHEFGWRLRKQYFLVKSKNVAKNISLLSWTSFGPDRALGDKDLNSMTKVLSNMKHPYIYPTSFTCLSDNGGLVIYDYVENGTLRDMLFKVKPKARFLKKYGKPKSTTIVNHDKIQLYGRHILLALKFLHDKGLFHGHIHTGNIILADGVCKLTDLFNSVMGIPSLMRPYFLQLRKVQTVENIDVYCFGHVIYEMAFGVPLLQSSSDSFPLSCSPELRSVLEATLSTEACKKGLPSVSDLLLHPFFVSASGNDEKVHLKLPSQLKDALKKAKDTIENRLKEEQKVIRRTQRLTKVQLTSEEEKKKRLIERRKQHKNLNSSSSTQNGLTSSPTPTETSSETPVVESLENSTPIPPPPPPLPPPLPASVPAPPPPPPLQLPGSPTSANDRSALLSSIQSFSKAKLKKCETNDHSTART